MAVKVFVSYSSADASLASSLYAYLNGRGIHAVKAPDDIRPGEDWACSITGMIESASHMVLVWTRHSMASKEVSKELTLAMQSHTVIIPFQVEDLAPEGAWRYHLANLHWLQAYSMDHDSACHNLVELIQGVAPPLISPADRSSSPASTKAPGKSMLGLIALLVTLASLLLNVAALVIAIWFGITQPAINTSVATIIGGIYRVIPPLSMSLYSISVVLAVRSLLRRNGRKRFAIGAICLTGIQLLAYAVGAITGILPH